MKLLHIADVHLDAPFRWLGSKGKDQRRQVKDTFRATVDLALEERVDAVLVAGDLCDCNSPPQDTLDFLRSELNRLNVPVFVLPGTHDCYDATSVYRKIDVFHSPQIHVFDETHTSFEIDSLSLTVHGKANRTNAAPINPLSGLERNPATQFNVAIAHGSLAMPGTENDYPLKRSDIEISKMDYVALGHWHSRRFIAGHQSSSSKSTLDLLWWSR
jgi:DNA repair exonuclease SbcCD nuclease subunit